MQEKARSSCSCPCEGGDDLSQVRREAAERARDMCGLKFRERAWYRGNVRRCAEPIPTPARCCLSGRGYLGCHRLGDLADLGISLFGNMRRRSVGDGSR